MKCFSKRIRDSLGRRISKSLQLSKVNICSSNSLSRAMLANRISFNFGLQGPSCTLDTACSSSMYALDSGFNAIRNGECDAALICGTNLLLHPFVSLQFARLIHFI